MSGAAGRVWARARAWLRGPQLAIGLVIVVLVLDYSTFRGDGRWKWPVEGWQMYAGKSHLQPVANWRRFLLHHEDGRSTVTYLDEAFELLAQPYRVDVLVGRDVPRFMVACVRERKRRRGDDGVIGLSLETRQWWYLKSSLAEHLAQDLPVSSYRVMEVSAPPAELRHAAPGADLLAQSNGDFTHFDPGTARPIHWQLSDPSWVGFGVDLATGDRSLLLPAPRDAGRRHALQAVPPPALDAKLATTVRFAALARTHVAGAAIEIQVVLQDGQTLSASSPDVLGDGAWHRAEATLRLEPGTEVATMNVVLHAGGDTYYDDAMLLVDGVPTDAPRAD